MAGMGDRRVDAGAARRRHTRARPAECRPATAFQDGYLKYLAFDGADGTFDWRTFNLDRDGSKLQPFMDEFSPTNPDLSKLRARGGKLILYHGWADPALSALGTIAYYEDVVKKAGGRGQSDRFVELFMVPGMHHCQGTGPGPNSVRHADRA